MHVANLRALYGCLFAQLKVGVLDTGLEADRGDFGLMFAIEACEGTRVSLEAFVARSFDPQSVDVTVFSQVVDVVGTEHTTLGWKGNLTSGHSWRIAGRGRLASTMTRLPLSRPIEIAPGTAVAFYLHTHEESGLAFSSFARAESSRNAHLRVLVGTRTEAEAPFEGNRLYKASFAGQIEYKVEAAASAASADTGKGGVPAAPKVDSTQDLLSSLANFL